MLDAALRDDGAVSDRAVGADKGALDPASLADDGRSPNRAPLHRGHAPDLHPSGDRALVADRAQDLPPGELIQHGPVGLQQVVLLSGIQPPALEAHGLYPASRPQQLLNGIGDLEFPAGRRPDARDGLVDAGTEEVDADERQVAGRGLGFLDERVDAAVAVEHGDPELARIGDLLQENQRIRPAAVESPPERLHAALDQVVAQEHEEGAVLEERARGEDRMGQPAGSVLGDVGRPQPPALPGADRSLDRRAGLRRDDDADLPDPRLRDLIEDEVEDRLVGHGDQLLCARVGQRPKPRPPSAAEDKTLQVLHRRSRPPPGPSISQSIYEPRPPAPARRRSIRPDSAQEDPGSGRDRARRDCARRPGGAAPGTPAERV